MSRRTRSSLNRHATRAGSLLRRRWPILVPIAVIAAAVLVLGLLQGTAPARPASSPPAYTYDGTWTLLELQRHVEAGEVAAITVAPGQPQPGVGPADGSSGRVVPEALVARTRQGQDIRIALASSVPAAVAALNGLGYGSLLTAEAWSSASAANRGDQVDPGIGRTLLGILPLLLILALVLFLWRRSTNTASGFGSSTTFMTILPGNPDEPGGSSKRPAGPSDAAGAVRLEMVAGCDEAKLELTEAIEFLKEPGRFRRMGAHIPRGVLLYGPPGTGKTMLARAVATEAGVPFIYTSGSEFVEKFVGVGARRVRDLFGQARKLGRAVIFFDEFDAIGKARGGSTSHEEREQTLNQLLVELDGFATSDDIVVIAATNRIDVLDPAALRPGRFTRKIHVGLPDVAGRRGILDVHAANKPLAEAVDLEQVARRTYGFSGAQLADLLNESAILAARRGSERIDPEDVHAGWLKVAVGTARRRSMDERERSIIAAHEVGHAICGRVHGDKQHVEEISLFAHGEALGVTVSSQEDNALPAESDIRARLIALMGGRAAEELLFQEVTAGAANDFDKANDLGTKMVTRWGMGRDPDEALRGVSGRGSLSFLVASGERGLPKEVEPAATRAVRHILDEAYSTACDTLVREMTVLRRIAAYLFEHERIDGDTFEALFEGRLAPAANEPEWRAGSAKPRQWAEIAGFLGQRRMPAIVPGQFGLAAAVPTLSAASAASSELDRADPSAGQIEAPAAMADRPRRSAMHRATMRRRLRGAAAGVAAGLLRQAEAWLRVPEEA
jgi:cell division protease FtsH